MKPVRPATGDSKQVDASSGSSTAENFSLVVGGPFYALMRRLKLVEPAPNIRLGPSFPEPQRTLPGRQSLQEDLQPQRQEFPIRVHREYGDLRGRPLR
jgi:hypothetical protein